METSGFSKSLLRANEINHDLDYLFFETESYRFCGDLNLIYNIFALSLRKYCHGHYL